MENNLEGESEKAVKETAENTSSSQKDENRTEIYRKTEKAVYEEVIRDVLLRQFADELKEDLIWYGMLKLSNKSSKPLVPDCAP